MHIASTVAMVRPASFGYNEETAANNFFQNAEAANAVSIQEIAIKEFDAMVELLLSNGIDVLVLQDVPEPKKPDAIFPNNWFSCMDDHITIFPMRAANRRTEKRVDLISQLQQKTGIKVLNDLSLSEKENAFLEGTGSMVIDHRNRSIYACLSARTDKKLLDKFATENNYSLIAFNAADEKGREVYHTNVMMCIGDGFSVICRDAIHPDQRESVLTNLSESGHELIPISFSQMNSFAGNMLQLQNKTSEKFIVLSRTAYNSLSQDQVKRLEEHSKLIIPDIGTIEKTGGGSVRCMMAELFY